MDIWNVIRVCDMKMSAVQISVFVALVHVFPRIEIPGTAKEHSPFFAALQKTPFNFCFSK